MPPKRGVKRKPARAAGGDGDEPPTSRQKKSVEETYQKKTPIEHVLLRPDTYVGSVEKQEDQLWVWDEKKGEMQSRKVSYVPALYKVFDEILVNAADNLQRDPKMNTIKVDIDAKKSRIKVWNNGKGLPVQIHKKHKMFVPELVFGHLLTSDNYDDSERKVTGGRNGFGAKLTNIFSKRFIVETVDKGKRFRMEWTNNMGKKSKPDVRKHTGGAYTCVEFWPDLAKFGMSDLDAEIRALMQRRVYDLAGTTGQRCAVYLNGRKLPVKSFEAYCALFHNGDGHAHKQFDKRWEILVGRSDGEGFQQCSFVNAISTPKGGTHVQYILDQLVDAIIAKASRAAGKGVEIKRVHVKNHLWVFINCLIENPAFSSQTKEQMTLKASKFGSSCSLSSAFIKEVLDNTGLLDAVVAEAQMKLTTQMDKMASSGSKGKRVLGIPKLEDANDAGGKDSKSCTLILTEGDSAKALAIAGLSVIGRDKFGVFPLRGKLLNVRDVAQKQVAENKEIMSLVKILGLSFDKKSAKNMDLRYGSVMIMADQDLDGSHIKGLLINLFHYWWPDLIKKNKYFLKEFITPIVKCSKGGDVQTFFTQTEYEKWKKKNHEGRGWHMKYYKGLGTSTAAEAKEYFKAIDYHRISFLWKTPKDGKLIDMAFNKGRSDDRKVWMNKYVEGTHVDHTKDKISYTDFINLELVQFSRYDLMRSVPSVMDGLKPTQRKVLYCSFKRGLRSDVKVAQLVGYVAEKSAYHHGEAALSGTIVSMAHDFVGSNNVNLLVPSGQFGTRLQGGKDAASARYIYTRLSPLTRLIFSPLDDAVLSYQDEEGQTIEPYWYVPIIPMILVNGAEGIGTGWSTSVPNYDPREIISNMRLYIKRKKMKPMKPWYRGFAGAIKPSGEKGKYDSMGVWNEHSKTIMEITELPVRRWTQDYKEFLQTMLPGSDKKTKINLYDVREYHTENRVHFVAHMGAQDFNAAKKEGVHDTFKLKTTISETNMVLFDHEGKIKKYKNVIDIMQEFAKVRLKYYDIRKKYLVNKLTIEKELLANRARFIGMIIAKKLHVNNRKKADVVKDLSKLKFRKFGDTTPPRTGYEYLLTMQIASLTKEKKEELERMLKDKSAELEQLKKTPINKMWEMDLDRLEAALTELYKAEGTDEAAGGGGSSKRSSRPGSSASSGRGRSPMSPKLWKGARKGKGGRGRGGKRGRSSAVEEAEEAEGAEEEEGEEGEGSGAPRTTVADPFDNPAGDMSRWTAGLTLGAKFAMMPGGKKRRRG